MARLRIAYITETSPHDRHAWSGTVHYVYRALSEAGHEMIALGPARPKLTRLLLAGLNQLSLLLFRKRIDYRHSGLYARAFASVFKPKLQNADYDLIVHCGTTECGAYLKSEKPIVYVLDRTIQGALNYHTILSGLWKFSENASIHTDKKAMFDSTMVFFSSDWAADHARKFYRLPDKKIKVLAFGANLDKVPERAEALTSKPLEKLKLLLVGTYWLNKGADIALNALDILLSRGFDAELTVVGCKPPENTRHPKLKIIEFVDKNSAEGLKTMWDLFMSHHFFILPTRFDCTPIVFCEASAFGLPCLSANTGGVAGHITENVNGFLIDYNDRGAGYADKIQEVYSDPGRYEAFRLSSRDLYESKLNWTHWAKKFTEEVEQILKTK